MTNITIEVEGLNEVMKAVDPKDFERMLMTTMQGATNIIREPLQNYPGPPTDAQKKLAVEGWTKKQRGWFFANLRAGTLQVPYARTMTLHKGWTVQVKRISGGVMGVIGNRIGYGPVVQDSKDQARIHKGRWPTVQGVKKDKEKEVRSFFERAISRWVSKRR